MTNATHDWDLWTAQWRTPRPATDVQRLLARTRAARRATALVSFTTTAMAAAAIIIVGLALVHAGNPLEATLGLVVGGSIASVWLWDARNRRLEWAVADATGDDYVAARRRLCVRQRALARVTWVVTALDLVFLVPWWRGGLAVHGSGFHPMQVITMWMPMAIMAAACPAAYVTWRRATAELRRLERMSQA